MKKGDYSLFLSTQNTKMENAYFVKNVYNGNTAAVYSLYV